MHFELICQLRKRFFRFPKSKINDLFDIKIIQKRFLILFWIRISVLDFMKFYLLILEPGISYEIVVSYEVNGFNNFRHWVHQDSLHLKMFSSFAIGQKIILHEIFTQLQYSPNQVDSFDHRITLLFQSLKISFVPRPNGYDNETSLIEQCVSKMRIA